MRCELDRDAPMVRFRRAVALSVLIAFSAAGADSVSGEASYREGARLAGEGRAAAARPLFEQSLAQSPKGAFADAALLALADLDAPGLRPDRWAVLPAQSLEKAQTRLEALLVSFPESDRAAGAAYRLGLLQMHPGNPKGSLESAHAALIEVSRRFPERDEAAQALYAAATCRLQQGARAASAAEDARVVTVFGGSSVAPAARIRLARSAAILGEESLVGPLVDPILSPNANARPEKGAEDHPDTKGRPLAPSSGSSETMSGADPEAEPSVHSQMPPAGAGAGVGTGTGAGTGAGAAFRDRAANVRSLAERAVRERAGSPALRPLDTAYTGPASPAEVLALEVDSRGSLWKLDNGSVVAVPVRGGVPSASNGSGEKTRGFALNGADEIYLWDDKGIVLPTGRRFSPSVPATERDHPGPVRRVGGLAISPRNDLIVIDAASNRVLRYAMDQTFRDVVASFESRPTAVRVGEDGTIWVLLGALKQIVTIAPSGRQGLLALSTPAIQIESPAGMSLDGLGRPHVLDSATKTVVVLDTLGRRVASMGAAGTASEAAKGVSGELRAPTAFAVDPAGRVYVADRKRDRIVRFQ